MRCNVIFSECQKRFKKFTACARVFNFVILPKIQKILGNLFIWKHKSCFIYFILNSEVFYLNSEYFISKMWCNLCSISPGKLKNFFELSFNVKHQQDVLSRWYQQRETKNFGPKKNTQQNNAVQFAFIECKK